MKEGDTTAQSGYAATRQLVLDELDTEIHVRERLQETVESRIAWATCLQSSLGAVAEKQEPGAKDAITGTNPFQLAAADALNVAEAPLLPILSREARFLTPPIFDVTPLPSATSSTNPYARPHTRHTRLRRSPSTIRTSPKILYFRDASTDTITRLVCPDCSRGDFPRVQSLLNHCRIQHGREFGSHDECIRGCAVQVPAEEEGWVIENGSELKHSGLPSLRRLFEIAVGSTGNSLEIASTNGTSTAQPSVSQDNNHDSERETRQTSPAFSSTHLSRTLGHHVDTPALAPFLGRAPKRRGILVHDENTPVDIDGRVDDVARRRWHKPFIHRSCARPALDIAITSGTPPLQYTPNITPVTEGTRFHIVARVTISDRSVWIPLDRRAVTAPNHTHRWFLCISAPTYSLPLGAILERATVTCLSPGPSPIEGTLEMSGPPFFISGTTAHPFLARLRLEWTNGSLNPPQEVDHWVELDMLHSGASVFGDEQVLDVELDRNTMFRPVTKPTQDAEPWNSYYSSPRVQADPAPALPGYVVLLWSLVPKFPLTLRDIKGKVSAPLPYKLVPSPAHFRALVSGRRKATEWARARALRDAYEKLREEKAPADDYPYLSTGDVFLWLADTGLSLRQVNTFCATCGLESSRHPSAQSSSWEGPSGGSCCRSSPMPRLPLLDVGAIAPSRSANGPVQSTRAQKGPFRWPIQDILAATDPSLTFAVRSIIAPLKLGCFPESQRTSISSAGVLRPNGTAIMVDGTDIINRCDLATISEALASVAVLALAVREFARRLVESAVTAFASDRRGRGSPRILVPAHISLGVAVADSFLTRDGVLAPPPPPTSPVALALATLVRHASRDLSPPSAVMDTPCSDPGSPAASQYAR